MYLTIGRNEYTSKLTRDNRFLIDDPDSPNVMAYQLTKPLKVGTTYGIGRENLRGIFKFVIQEVNTTDDDNLELMIPDYYKHFPDEKPGMAPPAEPGPVTNDDGKEIWL